MFTIPPLDYSLLSLCSNYKLPHLQLHTAMTYLLLIDLLDTYSSSVHVLQAFVPCLTYTSSSSLQSVRSDYPRPPTYLPFTVFNILCCCFILGIFAKRYGAKVGTSRNIRRTLEEIHVYMNLLSCLVCTSIHFLLCLSDSYPLPGSLQVIYEHERGNYEEAKKASRKALNYNIASLLSGIAIWIIVVACIVAYFLI